jgi:hypothetical protein
VWIEEIATPTPVPTCTDGDLDGDRICDGLEGDKSPNEGESSLYLPDSDGDGLLDWEEDLNLNGQYDGPLETYARRQDSDGDSFEDGVERFFYGDALDPSVPSRDRSDDDSDGLPIAVDPTQDNPDTDADRFKDGCDAAMGRDLSWATDPEKVPPLGDVDDNGTVDNADAQRMLNFFANKDEGPIYVSARNDMTRDAWIDNADAQVVLNFFGNIIETLPMPWP